MTHISNVLFSPAINYKIIIAVQSLLKQGQLIAQYPSLTEIDARYQGCHISGVAGQRVERGHFDRFMA